MTPIKTLVVTVAMLLGLILLLPILLVAGFMAGGAAFTRWAASRLQRAPQAVPWHDLVEYEPEIGWRLRPDLDVYGQADDVFHLTTGPDGWRGSVSLDDADLVVFGDSYAFGHGASDERMYTAFTGNLRVKPVGSDGYDMVQALLWMDRYAERLSNKLVVWFVYYGNDLYENLLPTMSHYRKPFIRQVNGSEWEIVTDHVSPEPWPFPSGRSYHERLAEISCQSPLGQQAFSACSFLIGRAHQLCERAGANLAVVGVPDRVQLTRRGQQKLRDLAPDNKTFEVGRPDRELAAICGELGIAFVPLSEHLSPGDYLLQDIHWRTSGHRRVGELLSSLASHRLEAMDAGSR